MKKLESALFGILLFVIGMYVYLNFAEWLDTLDKERFPECFQGMGVGPGTLVYTCTNANHFLYGSGWHILLGGLVTFGLVVFVWYKLSRKLKLL